MNKWIAEFELEDGDTMPEHMDLNYKGVKIDFHCKSLEQVPKSEWEQDHAILKAYSDGANEALDKIRAEIVQLRTHKAQFITNDNRVCIDSQEVLNVIDKYKGESEGENGNDD